jgi:hypothetical protein
MTWKELILDAYSKGKTIQSNHSGKWSDFSPQNQVDRPNLNYGTEDNWRIKE